VNWPRRIARIGGGNVSGTAGASKRPRDR